MSSTHDAGSHNQPMTPALQRVIDAADQRARDNAAMPATCPTASGCRAHGCHGACLPTTTGHAASPMREDEIRSALLAREEPDHAALAAIGRRIGYGRAQQILGELWDAMLHECYGAAPGRGGMGVTVDDDLPPVPKAATPP